MRSMVHCLANNTPIGPFTMSVHLMVHVDLQTSRYTPNARPIVLHERWLDMTNESSRQPVHFSTIDGPPQTDVTALKVDTRTLSRM